MAESWDIDPTTGDYIMQNGAPSVTQNLSIPAYIRLKTKRTKWQYAPDSKYGSDFYLIKKRSTTNDSNILEGVAAAALQPILDDGRASDIEVTTVAVALNGVGMDVDITDAQGQDNSFTLPGLGV